MAQVRCATHGVFDYKTAACPGCLNDARRRYEELVHVSDRQRTRLFGDDAAPAPISAEALAILRGEDAVAADLVLVELDREERQYEERRHERKQLAAAFAALSSAHGRKHRLGSSGSKYEGRLLGAVDVGTKRYARLRQSFLDGGEVVCVPWIDAFAERVGHEIMVQWLDTNDARPFRVSDRDGKIEDDE